MSPRPDGVGLPGHGLALLLTKGGVARYGWVQENNAPAGSPDEDALACI